MKKVPSALKWLAEKRARIAGELKSALQLSERLLGAEFLIDGSTDE
jgi:hypothetical protein